MNVPEAEKGMSRRRLNLIVMKNYEVLSVTEMNSLKGGQRIVVKIDVDGDGKWDVKRATNTRTGKTKCKVRF
jgi:divalent metal cation (Fe/Co/Zn/Cd) transporter